MLKDKVAVLYICSAISVMIIVVLMIKIYKKRTKELPILLRGSIIIMETPNGVIRVDSETAAKELEIVAKDIRNHTIEVPDSPEFRDSLQRVVDSLKNFVDKNTFSRMYSNSEILTTAKMSQLELNLEAAYGGRLSSNLLNTPLFNIDGDNDQEPVYFLDDDAIDTAKKIGVVADHIDVVLKMLRENTAAEGKLNVTDLYKLQNELRKRIGCTSQSCRCNNAGKCSQPVLMAELMNRAPIIGIEPNPLNIDPVIRNFPAAAASTLNPELNDIYGKQQSRQDDIIGRLQESINSEKISKEGFSNEPVNTEIQKKLDIIDQQDLYTTNPIADQELGGTWEKFIKAHPQGIIKRYGDIDAQDLLGYRLNGSFQASLYDYDDQYRLKMSRCLQNKYRNLEDETIFDRCMGWY